MRQGGQQTKEQGDNHCEGRMEKSSNKGSHLGKRGNGENLLPDLF